MKIFFIMLTCTLCLFTSHLKASTFSEDIVSPITNQDAQKILIIGASTTLIASLFKSTFIQRLQKEIHEDQPICCKLTDPGDKFLQIVPNILYTLGYGLNFYLSKDEDSKRRAIGMAKATAYAGLFTDVLKPIINERRPSGGKWSFPSGHTTTAFAFASFVANEHPWYVGLPAYIMATYVGLCRIQGNHHFAHDVLAGATIGMSYGVAISSSSKNETQANSAFIVIPTEELKGLSLKYALQF